MAFVLVGQVNVLAPVVTINFMLTYIAVDYSYFALSMAHCGLAQSPEPVPRQGPDALHCSERLLQDKAPSYGSDTPAGSLSEGTLLEFTKDMDQLLQPIGGLESQPRSREGNQVLKSQKLHSFLFKKGTSVPQRHEGAKTHTPCAFHRADVSKAGGVPLSLKRPKIPGSHFPDPSLAFYGHHGSWETGQARACALMEFEAVSPVG